MALERNESDRKLSELIDDYEPPSEEEMQAWLDAAPHPRDAVEYPNESDDDSTAVVDGGDSDSYDPTDGL